MPLFRSAFLILITALCLSPAAKPQNFAALCNGSGLLCVSSSLVHSEISVPLDFTVIINSPDEIYVAWEVADSTGQILESNSTYDFLIPVTSTAPSRKALHIKDYFLKPAKSDTGFLTLTPSRFDTATGKSNLPPLEIPVRLTIATTQLTYLLPKDEGAFISEVAASIDNQSHKNFSAKTPLTLHTVTAMKVNPDQIIGATAEATSLGYPGQGPWHIIDARRDGDTAHLTLAGGGWTGVTYYLTGLNYLLTQSVLRIPGVKHVEFDQPPSP
jgi:hypothetical protein